MPHSLRYRVAPAVASSENDGEITILDPRSGLYFGLEDVGAELWRQLAQPHSIRELCESMSERYEVTSAECMDDVRGLVEELIERGLVEVVPAA